MKPRQTPFLTTDIIIELVDRPSRPILLIQRANPPYGWAIPGGFVDPGERVETAARREALEETSLEVKLVALLGVYSDPKRDPRMHTVSCVYVAEAHGTPQAADDAKAVQVVEVDQLPSPLAFDHDLILQDYLHFRQSAQPAPLREA
ncbi:MAG: NUDIX hydrolase [Magnetococcales bacterium]|nr:NUDIX hydrolase [Magnetococcales bacterium]NGZ26982.1 NUDIX hydrolase [Magnetococcales bacterium]